MTVCDFGNLNGSDCCGRIKERGGGMGMGMEGIGITSLDDDGDDVV